MTNKKRGRPMTSHQVRVIPEFRETPDIEKLAQALIGIAVSLADYFLPAWMTRRFGGSRAGSIGATIGIFVGFFAGPVGIILGPFVGAVIGELVNDRSDFAKALVVGFGSFLSFFVGTGIKLIVAVGILVHVVADIWVHVVADIWPAFWNWLTNLF